MNISYYLFVNYYKILAEFLMINESDFTKDLKFMNFLIILYLL